MSVHVHILATSKEMRPHAARLRRVTQRAVAAVKKCLPLKDVDIVLYHYPERTIPEFGIGGFTPDANTVFIALNPRNSKFERSVKKELFSTLVHELHHAVRCRTIGYGSTLWNSLIFEGLADHFDMEISGRKKPPPWSRALTEKQKKIWLKRAQPILHRPHFSPQDYRVWFIGSKKSAIPRWTGYTLGYDVVAAYLRTHPTEAASSLVSVPADDFRIDDKRK